jgi:hypothetical protein
MTQEFKIKPLTKKLQRFIQKNPETIRELKKGAIRYIAVDTAREMVNLYLRLSGFKEEPVIFNDKPQDSVWKYPIWGIKGFNTFLTENEQSSKVLSLGLASQTLYEVTPEFIQSLPGGDANV